MESNVQVSKVYGPQPVSYTHLFNSTQSFYAAFKAVYGMTPREYIRRHYAGGEKK